MFQWSAKQCKFMNNFVLINVNWVRHSPHYMLTENAKDGKKTFPSGKLKYVYGNKIKKKIFLSLSWL